VEIPLAAERPLAGLRVMGRGSRKQPDRCRGTFVHELQNGKAPLALGVDELDYLIEGERGDLFDGSKFLGILNR
jgi:hypothetical protein